VEGGGGAEQSAARGIVGAGTPQQSGGDAASDEAERSAKARPCRARRPFHARAACQRAPHCEAYPKRVAPPLTLHHARSRAQLFTLRRR
jgi:hypothetical protein